jgi:glycosyltransferase involved in cell wall biosynthesis
VPLIAFGASDRIIAVSEFIANEARCLVKDPDKVMVVYNGLDHSLFKDTGLERNICTTVGNVTPSAYRVKGIDNFLNVVDGSPTEHFNLVGRTDLGIKVEKRTNLELTGYKGGEELVEVLNRSKFYLQLSVREGFGLAVAEAMSCGCIPVVTDRGALPEVVGDTGYVVPHGDWGKVCDIVRGEYDPEMGKRARNRAIDLFGMEHREMAIFKIISDMMK